MNQRLSMQTLVLIITTTVFSFSSMTTAFFMMGTKSLLWFLISSCCYFIPYTLIVSSYTRTYAKQAGGIYDWLKDSLSPKAAFITAFLWYCSYFTWIVSLFMKLLIPLSILFFGQDITQQATWFGLPTNIWIAVLAITAVFSLTYLISRGFQTVLRFLLRSGIVMLGLLLLSTLANAILIVQQPASFLRNLQQSFQAPTFFAGTGDSLLSQLPFFIFAVTAFGGLDTVASLADKTGGDKRRFPRALIISAGAIVLLYFAGIILWSGANDLTSLRQTDQLHLGNLMYGLMGSLAQSLATSLHLSTNSSQLLYQIFIRYTALTLVISYLGLLSSITYAPLKSLIQGTPKAIWPTRWTRLNSQQMPAAALWVQAAAIAIGILILSLNNPLMSHLFNQLTYMTNIARALPYFVVAFSYPFFMKKSRHYYQACCLSLAVCSSILVAVGFQLYEPMMAGNYTQSLWLVAGPLLFGLAGHHLYRHFEQPVLRKNS